METYTNLSTKNCKILIICMLAIYWWYLGCNLLGRPGNNLVLLMYTINTLLVHVFFLCVADYNTWHSIKSTEFDLSTKEYF